MDNKYVSIDVKDVKYLGKRDKERTFDIHVTIRTNLSMFEIIKLIWRMWRCK